MASRRLKSGLGIVIVLLLFGLLAGGIAWWKIHSIEKMKQAFLAEKTAPVVSAGVVKTQDLSNFISSIGSTVAAYNVDIVPETSGIVSEIYFKSGDYVEKGAPLIKLHDEEELARLASDKSSLALAKISYQRNLDLLKQHAIAKQSVDESLANYQKAQAAVKLDNVLVAQKHIVAPFAGRLGIRQVSLGQYINNMPNGNSSPIVNLQSIDPMYVDFNLPQQDLSRLKIGQVVKMQVDAYPNQEYSGKITAINAGVNEQSRMIAVRAEIPNADHRLFGGMFARVSVVLPPIKNVLVVPPTAVTYNIYGDLIYVIEKKDDQLVVQQRFVSIGDRRADFTVIKKGVKAGEQIVIDGQSKLFPGSPVTISQKANSNTSSSSEKLG